MRCKPSRQWSSRKFSRARSFSLRLRVEIFVKRDINWLKMGMQGLSMASLKKNPAVSNAMRWRKHREIALKSENPQSYVTFRFNFLHLILKILIVILRIGVNVPVILCCRKQSSIHKASYSLNPFPCSWFLFTFASELVCSEQLTTFSVWPQETQTSHGTVPPTQNHGKRTVTSSTRWETMTTTR